MEGGRDRLWYKDAVFYELSVRAFCDSDDDGVGDFPGLTSRLDYLQDMGVGALLLQPFQPSPLRDGGYDVADHVGVHPQYGSMADFERFVAEAHRRGLRVIPDLVLNHTSDQHPWFQRGRRARPDSRERRFYVWSDRPDRYREARVLFGDREEANWTWDPVAGAYYWHRFYSHQPDLNFESPDVRRHMLRAASFWLAAGADGLRLDAAPYLYEAEGTTCEDLPASHAFLRQLRRHVDRNFPGLVLLAGADAWPEEAARYFGAEDECHLTFYTPLVPRLFTALRCEDRQPIVDLLEQTPAIPPSSQWVLFLRNHDELTLETVSDEERDLMYRAYAPETEDRVGQGIRRRLAPLLGNDRRRIELLYGLLFSLPGTPAIYYGDELGMGDNVLLRDRNALRTPMQWSDGTNGGFSGANPQRLYLPLVTDPPFSYTSVNVAAQAGNPRSLLSWTRELIARRRRLPAFGRGTLSVVPSSSRSVLAFVRQQGEERVLVVASLSHRAQHVELDLAPWTGLRPVEVSGRTEFPVAGEAYPLALGAHAFYWFTLEDTHVRSGEGPARPCLRVKAGWEAVLQGEDADALSVALASFLSGRRWFAAKARRIESVSIDDAVALPAAGAPAWLALARVTYSEGEPDLYALPLAFASGAEADELRRSPARPVIAELQADPVPGVLHAAEGDPGFARALLEALAGGRRLEGRHGEVVASHTAAFEARGGAEAARPPSPLSAEQSNTSIRYGHAFILKLFRRLQPGVNPDLEVGTFLTERAAFAHTPPVCGALVYEQRGESTTLGILQGFVPNQGDAWSHVLGRLAQFFGDAVASDRRPPPEEPALPVRPAAAGPPPWTRSWLAPSVQDAALLGRRTGELHHALASDPHDAAFAPEPFSARDRRAAYQSQRYQANATFDLLGERLSGLPSEVRDLGARVAGLRGAVLDRYRRLLERPLTALRTRTHGDYHLGQVLWTGSDFVIIDFEGEPARPTSVRRAKRSPLRDVAGMLRSFHYAAYHGLAALAAGGTLREGGDGAAEAWARFWHLWVTDAFLRGYLDVAGPARLLPEAAGELEDLLAVHLLEKAVYELAYELNSRPAWVRLPLLGILALAEGRP